MNARGTWRRSTGRYRRPTVEQRATEQAADPTDTWSDLVDAVRRRLALSGAAPTPARVAEALRAEDHVMGDTTVLDVVRALSSELLGAGPLEPLLREPTVTDVLVNNPEEVWVDRGGGLRRAPVRFPDERAVRALAQRLAGVAGRRLDDAQPWVDARLPDGTRLHTVLAPVAVDCTCLSLRVVRPRAFTLPELVQAGSLPHSGARLLHDILRARLSFLISGGTGTGKTTLLASLLGLADPEHRLVLAEDSAELRPHHPHVLRLEGRPANQEGLGRVSLHDLVRQALRMRPDRLVVGEVRGAEVTDLLAALNTGHEGGCGTVHANAAADVPARLEALGASAGLDRSALHSQLASALDLVVHLVRGPDGVRRVAELHVLRRTESGLVGTVPAVLLDPRGGCRRQPGFDRLVELCVHRGLPPPDLDGAGGHSGEDNTPCGSAPCYGYLPDTVPQSTTPHPLHAPTTSWLGRMTAGPLGPGTTREASC